MQLRYLADKCFKQRKVEKNWVPLHRFQNFWQLQPRFSSKILKHLQERPERKELFSLKRKIFLDQNFTGDF